MALYIVGSGLSETPPGYDGYFNDLTTMNAGISNGDSVDIKDETFTERLYLYKTENIYGLDSGDERIVSPPTSSPKITWATHPTILPYDDDTTALVQGIVVEATGAQTAMTLTDQGSGAPANKTFRYCKISAPSGAGTKVVQSGANCTRL